MSSQEYDKYLQLLQSDATSLGVAEDNLSEGALDAIYLLASRGKEVGQDAESIFNLCTDFSTSLIQEVQERWMEFKRDSSYLETLGNSAAPTDRVLASEIKNLRGSVESGGVVDSLVGVPGDAQGYAQTGEDLDQVEEESYYQDLSAEEAADDLFYSEYSDEESLSWSEMSDEFESYNPVEDYEEPAGALGTEESEGGENLSDTDSGTAEAGVDAGSFQSLLSRMGGAQDQGSVSGEEPDWSSYANPEDEGDEEEESPELDWSSYANPEDEGDEEEESPDPDWSSYANPEGVSEEEEDSSPEPDWSSYSNPEEDILESESVAQEQVSEPEGNGVEEAPHPSGKATLGTERKKVRYSEDEGENAILENVMGAYNFFRNVNRKRTR